MKIQGSKKTALLVLLIFVGILSVVLFVILYKTFGKEYPDEPIKMKNFGSSIQSLDLTNYKKNNNVKDTPLYFVTPKLHTSDVEKMIDNMGLSLVKTEIIKDSYITWSDKENTFTYDAVEDTVSFVISRRVSLERGENSFKSFFSKYLGRDYEFVLEEESKNSDGSIKYYGSRMIDEIPMQFGMGYEYTDILSFNKEGNLEGGKILLTEIERYDYYLPIISDVELKKFVNAKTYPKEHYVDTTVLSTYIDLHYLSDDWLIIEDTLSECKAGEAELIYMYKTSNQGYLLPTFKIYSSCKVTYEENEYTVPATFYVNAVDPRYVSL